MNTKVPLALCKDFDGLLLSAPPEAIPDRLMGGTCMVDGKEIAATIQCVHCGCHWIPVQGSGRRRGFCMICNGPLCGAQRCIETCLPWQKKLDIDENPALATQVSVSLANLRIPGV